MAYKQSQNRNKRLKKLESKTRNSYGAGAYYDKDKECYVRYSCHCKKLKLSSRRRIRRRLARELDKDPSYRKGNLYRKYHDYWWELL